MCTVPVHDPQKTLLDATKSKSHDEGNFAAKGGVLQSWLYPVKPVLCLLSVSAGSSLGGFVMLSAPKTEDVRDLSRGLEPAPPLAATPTIQTLFDSCKTHEVREDRPDALCNLVSSPAHPRADSFGEEHGLMLRRMPSRSTYPVAYHGSRSEDSSGLQDSA